MTLVLGVPESSARLQPYFILRNDAADGTQLKPRVLFVLDTSGSMSARSQPGALADLESCAWEECESPAFAGTTRESRLAAARRAINEVIETTGDNAKFALMTFEQNDPPTAQPWGCNVGGVGRRFAWITWAQFTGGYPWNRIQPHGYDGFWNLCQGNNPRPYPYLRWDNLGVNPVIVSNDEVGPVPPSPLIDTSAASFRTDTNARRPVQWFPNFMGVRFQPNATTDPGRAITYATVGDWGNTNAQRDTYVWENDFYYWPYVDGFPGYAHWNSYAPDVGSYGLGGYLRPGVIGENSSIESGKLYSPFYFDFDGIPIDPDQTGPATEGQAIDQVLAHTSPLIYGGVDSIGFTPWASTIGDIPGATLTSNAINSHTTVASYLTFVSRIPTPDQCAPTAAVLITDGEPYPASEGGPVLYERLADLRRELGADVYVVGFFTDNALALNDMACAGAGACDGFSCSSPCDDAPTDAWDTCANPEDPANGCAYQSTSAEELQEALTQIVEQIGDFDVPSGPGSSANEFGVDDGAGDEIEAIQTTLSARTDYPSWHGHVERAACDLRDPDTGDLLPQCVIPEIPLADQEEAFGPCDPSRVWDAGACLSEDYLTNWYDRRIYTNTVDNQVIRVSEPDDGTATPQFVAELTALGLVGGADAEAEADEIVAFLLGRDAPQGWRLPGLANSAPIIVRRIPPYDPTRTPAVSLTDPHCGGRLLGAADGVPPSLEEYAEDVWDEDTLLPLPSPHYEAQEAVIVGDDFGVLHAFQLDSGNELWGYIPRFMLESLAAKAEVGAASFGQSGSLDNHSYGLAATINRGWVFDDSSADADEHRWRQLAIIGAGPGGNEYVVLDVSHMSPSSPRGPFEVMWTTEDPALVDAYDQFNGETWARPAMGYHVPGEVSTQTPDAYFVMGSGYPSSGGDPEQGRTLMRVDALTGEIVEYAVLPAVASGDAYEDSFGTVVDTSVGSHCLSRLWAEMQEVYVADPAGRLFRWDLGRETAHAGDSGGTWGTVANMALAEPLPACEGAGDTCTVNTSNPGEPFAYAPAVTSNDRLDDITSVTTAGPLSPTDQFLVALVGGSRFDDTLRTDSTGADYHSSLFVLVDDHSGDSSAGFDVPPGAPLAGPGAYDGYMRMALSQIERTRNFIPFEGASPIIETRTFNRGTRPIRAPRIFVTGVVDQDTGEIFDGIEVYFIEFSVYEPPTLSCDAAFYDAANNVWHQDPGSTYVVTFRLTADVASGFDLINGADAGAGADFDDAFDQGGTGLTLESVEQIGTGDCANGGCGPELGSPFSAPCDNNATGNPSPTGSGSALAVTHKELGAFTPIE
ncbi:MAG: hypothetical protein AB1Z98_05685 [Nannocystaceae bacterium]